MSNRENEKFAEMPRGVVARREGSLDDPLADARELIAPDTPDGVDRRSFLMRVAVGGAAAVMTGCSSSPEERTAKAAATATPAPAAAAPSAPPLAEDLDVVQKGKGPILTTVDEFYKVGPGPSSSHTIGPMRITCDFSQRASKLPADKLA